MATIIDSLTVLLNLDPKGFTDNQKKAAEALRDFRRASEENDKAGTKRADAMDQEEKRRQRERDEARAAELRKQRDTARGMEQTQRESAKKQAEAFTTAKEAALGFGAAIAALGVEKLVLSTATGVAATARLARSLDMSTKNVAAFGLAVQQSIGGSTEDAIGTLARFNSQLFKLQTGQDKSLTTGLFAFLKEYDPLHQPFQTVGPDGRPLDEFAVLRQIAERGQRTDPRQFSMALSEAGFSPEVTAFLMKGPAFDEAALASARERAPGDKEAAADQQLINASTKLSQSFSRLDEVVVGNLAPWLTRSISRMTDFINLLTGHIDWNEFQRLRAVRKHEEAKQNYLLQGMSDAEAERRASMDDTADDGLKITNTAPQTLGVAPPGTTEEQGSGFWGWMGNALGIHLYRKNKVADSSASAAPSGSSGLPADIEAEVRKDAAKYGVDPDHMVRLFAAEGGGYDKVSSKGAFGPAQLLPGTAAQMGVATSINDPSYDWRQSVDAGVRYWLMQWLHFRQVAVADAAYHNGPNDPAVLRFWRGADMSGFGPHARDYLKSIDGLLAAAPFSGVQDYSGAQPAPGGATNIASETNIGSIIVNTDAKSAAGIASGIRAEISKSPLVGKGDKGTF